MIDLTTQERMILANQCKIIEALYDGERDDYARMREALEMGIAAEIDSCFVRFTENLITREVSSSVHDVLLMYGHLADAIERHGTDGIDNAGWLRFKGYDGNNEYEHLAYCRYILKDPERYRGVVERGDVLRRKRVGNHFLKIHSDWRRFLFFNKRIYSLLAITPRASRALSIVS